MPNFVGGGAAREPVGMCNTHVVMPDQMCLVLVHMQVCNLSHTRCNSKGALNPPLRKKGHKDMRSPPQKLSTCRTNPSHRPAAVPIAAFRTC